MKTSDSFSLASSVPSLFQIAAFFEDFFPSRGFRQPISPANQLPIAEFMVNPEKLMKLLRSGLGGNHVLSVVAAPEKAPIQSKRSATKNVTAKKPAGQPPEGKAPDPSSNSSKKVEFTLKSPGARSVKLAGDFTNWEKSPLEMVNSKDGVWSTAVPLAPGLYSYRFIVDGQWCDDPGSAQQVPNPFGTKNAIVRVA